MSQPAPPSPWIRGPLYDGVLFVFAPLLALLAGGLVQLAGLPGLEVRLLGVRTRADQLLMGTFVAAHLVIVLCRSHLDRRVFARHPWRFVAVPLLLLALFLASRPAMVAGAVLSIWWDVYHSSLQTFGLGRIYDQRRGNDPQLGRSLDLALNLLLYVGPLLAGAALLPHLQASASTAQVVTRAFDHVPAWAGARQGSLTWALSGAGLLFLAAYVLAYRGLARRGYRVSWQKVALLASTGLCSIFAWGWNAFGQAFFIMNFFHALQYFGIVWWAEGGNLTRLLRLERAPGGRLVALSTLLSLAGLYGLVTETLGETSRALGCLALVVALMHFWWDGFIWSVRERMV